MPQKADHDTRRRRNHTKTVRVASGPSWESAWVSQIRIRAIARERGAWRQTTAVISDVNRPTDIKVVRGKARQISRTSDIGRISPGSAVRSDNPDPRGSPGRPRYGRLPPILCPRRW